MGKNCLIILFVFLICPNVWADQCEDWFKNLHIDPSSKDCEMHCAMAGVNMGTFDCPLGCKDYCKSEIKNDKLPPTICPEGGNCDIKVKKGESGANINNVKEQITSTYGTIVDVFKEYGAPVPVITSGNDGQHRSDSKHYENLAIDLRANNISDDLQKTIASEIQKKLGSDYYVDAEIFPEKPKKDHIHIEYDPK